MGFEMIFMVAVLGIAGLHLVARLVKFVSRSNRQKAVQVSSEVQKRDDWYMFFEQSALSGKSVKPTQEAEQESPSTIDESSDTPACDNTCQPQNVYA